MLARVQEDRYLELSGRALEPADALAFVGDPEAGGEVLFVGTVRGSAEEGAVTGLDYEAYEELALRRMGEIADEVFAKWPVRKAYLAHRTGRAHVGEPTVLVAVSCPHRAEAFEAARHAIDRIKEHVPIWKKELLAQGEARWR